jgi:hypothetical protein
MFRQYKESRHVSDDVHLIHVRILEVSNRDCLRASLKEDMMGVKTVGVFSFVEWAW